MMGMMGLRTTCVYDGKDTNCLCGGNGWCKECREYEQLLEKFASEIVAHTKDLASKGRLFVGSAGCASNMESAMETSGITEHIASRHN